MPPYICYALLPIFDGDGQKYILYICWLRSPANAPYICYLYVYIFGSVASNRLASSELVSSEFPLGVSAFTQGEGSSVVLSFKILCGGASSPDVSCSTAACAGPLREAGTGIVASSRESLTHVRLDDQISAAVVQPGGAAMPAPPTGNP